MPRVSCAIAGLVLIAIGGYVAVTPAAVGLAAFSDHIAEAAPDVAPQPLPGHGMRTTDVRRYSMSGYVRPLLFWFGRDDIGLARVVWRTGEDGGRAYELLVGTDPAKAPRALNRWGFVSEEVRGEEGALLALMTGSDETSYEEQDEATKGRGDGNDFRAIHSRVHAGATAWQTVRVQTPGNFSVHDVDTALDRVRQETAGARSRQAPLPEGARPGFLVALAELIDRGAGQLPTTESGRRARDARVRYVFGQGTYELRLRNAERATLAVNGRPATVVRSEFEIRTLATDAKTRFEVTFGAEGPLASVPVAAAWQPRWWLKVELRLAPSDAG